AGLVRDGQKRRHTRADQCYETAARAAPDYEARSDSQDGWPRARVIHGASVGGASSMRCGRHPADTRTAFFARTITPSTCGSRSINSMPAVGPRTKTPVDNASASVALSATMVTLRQAMAGSPRAGVRV